MWLCLDVKCGGNHPTTPGWSAVESWSDMCDLEEDPPAPIAHCKLRVELTCVMWRTHPTLSTISHQQLGVEVTCAIWRTHPTLAPNGHWQLRVEMKCATWRTHAPYYPIGHQQLRVEVTCVMWRIHPSLPPTLAIDTWKLKLYVQCGGPTLPYHPWWSLAVRSWSDMCNVEDPPYPIPSWPSAV